MLDPVDRPTGGSRPGAAAFRKGEPDHRAIYDRLVDLGFLMPAYPDGYEKLGDDPMVSRYVQGMEMSEDGTIFFRLSKDIPEEEQRAIRTGHSDARAGKRMRRPADLGR